ncbi:MAG: hypothetical protein ABIP02_09120 [Arenimonas sp.]
MNEYLSTTLKVITALAIGFITNFLMTQIAAPGHHAIALGVGVLLTSFGFMFAKYFMEIVTLPFAIVSMVLRLARGNKIKPRAKKGRDKFEILGRVLFVAAYGFVSAVTGIFIGAIDDGLGWFATSALFGTVGMLLAVLIPEDVIWALDDSDVSSGTPTAAAKAEHEQARKDGDPAVLFVDKVAKGAIDILIGKFDTDDKR